MCRIPGSALLVKPCNTNILLSGMARYIAAGEGNDPRRRTKMILSQDKKPSAYKMLLWWQGRGPPLTPAPGFDYKTNAILDFCFLT